MANEAGKGDKQRLTNHNVFSNNYDIIFKKNKAEPYKVVCDTCGKQVWFDPNDSYADIHTCTPKENQLAYQSHTEK